MQHGPDDFLLSSYRYDLPEAQIAQHPPAQRGASRLLVLNRRTGHVRHSAFPKLADHLPPRALLVANSSRVVAARLSGSRSTGGRVECMLLTPLPLMLENARDTGNGSFQAEVECLFRNAKKIREGETLVFGPLRVAVLERGVYGRRRTLLEWQGSLGRHFAHEGHIPLPPYIRRADAPEDAERYQTVYAREEGSIAAPTAGLHFTRDLLHALTERHFAWVEICLHVGYGTFSPVRCKDIRNHHMHREYFVISPENAHAVAQAKSDGRPVIAVGTTAARALEACVAACGTPAAFKGWTDIFLYPGAEFRVTDGLITNFHLPESSLLMLVSAFAGRKNILSAYMEAVQHAYRFFSYGDAMLIV
ncbi:MAG: tRNA preQ1(34) S-adenosylmethionine ribosyltransferase-isomerase QueA [Deltaproteobacteria bacterium]|jgi:S-adenosylmethionine:tRNA ribosyltransferase-isomerase|nr:tRNA preQ1(34) S-adenosylmethionine ribosyltransferase-isomerase QueA [Deltaproteobacteria bacterium]